MNKHLLPFWLLYGLAAVLLTACAGLPFSQDSPSTGRRGRVLLWHTWTDAESKVLDSLLASYMELHPNVDVISVAVGEEDIFDSYADRNASGLGPDLLLVDAATLYEMALQGYIQDLSGWRNVDFTQYLSTAMSMVSEGNHIHGLPFSLHTQMLFYNRELVDSPPEDLATLAERAAQGEAVALHSGFAESHWGVGAYDGGIFDEDGRLLMGLGGFANWLDALQTIRTLPGFVLDEDAEDLRSAFVDGEAAYYVGNSAELPGLQEDMGADKVGLALLPHGPNGSAARPLLFVDAFAFSEASSPAERALARDLVQHLTGSQEQFDLAMSDIGRLPTHNEVGLTRGMPEHTILVARQSRATEVITFENRKVWKEITTGSLGMAENHRRVVQGSMAPNDMVQRALAAVSEQFGLPIRTIAPDETCPSQPGTITIWHALEESEARAFEEVAAHFEDACPGVNVETTFLPSDDIFDQYVEVASAGGGPDLLFESSRWLPQLAELELIQSLAELVPAGALQQFLPRTVQAMRYQGQLYGIPESLTLLALFYNSEQVTDPPIDLEQLTQDVSAEERWALPVGFFWGYWGMAPFGGFHFDEQTGEILDTTGLIGWLEWLQSEDTQPGMDLLFDWTEGERAFIEEEAVYFISGPWSLRQVHEALGEDGFRVVALPNGPDAAGSPILQVQGSMINSNADAVATGVALAFADFLSLPENQIRLLETGSHVPASIVMDLEPYPHIAGFRAQTNTAALVTENAAFAALQEQGDELYRSVLIEGADPEEAVERFVEVVHEANNVDE